jgi:predicted Zn-dependent protease with MMP-like domain
MTDSKFQQLVADALDALPDQFREALKNIAIVVEEWPSETTRREMNLPSKYDLLGLYQGTSLPEREHGTGVFLPDVITLYRRPIERRCRTDRDRRREITKTLFHEVGHYFGLDEERLAELGFE